MQLLLIGLAFYALSSSTKSSAPAPAPATQKPVVQNGVWNDLGAFVGGVIAGAVSAYGEDDSP